MHWVFDSFEKYYKSKYSIEIQNSEQPLLDVDHTSARLNFLTPRYVNRKGVALPTSRSDHSNDFLFYLARHHGSWWQIMHTVGVWFTKRYYIFMTCGAQKFSHISGDHKNALEFLYTLYWFGHSFQPAPSNVHTQIWWTFDILEIVLINIHNLTIGYFIFLFLARDADYVCYNFTFCLGLYHS